MSRDPDDVTPKKKKRLVKAECPKCKDGKKHTPHPCPYDCEIFDDGSIKCTCCEECSHECAMDV